MRRELQLFEHRLIRGARRFVLGLRANVIFLDADLLFTKRMRPFVVGLGLFVLRIAGHQQLAVVSHRLVLELLFQFRNGRVRRQRLNQGLRIDVDRRGPLLIGAGKAEVHPIAGQVELCLADFFAVDHRQDLPGLHVLTELDGRFAQHAVDHRVHVGQPIFIDCQLAGDRDGLLRLDGFHSRRLDVGRRLTRRVEAHGRGRRRAFRRRRRCFGRDFRTGCFRCATSFPSATGPSAGGENGRCGNDLHGARRSKRRTSGGSIHRVTRRAERGGILSSYVPLPTSGRCESHGIPLLRRRHNVRLREAVFSMARNERLRDTYVCRCRLVRQCV